MSDCPTCQELERQGEGGGCFKHDPPTALFMARFIPASVMVYSPVTSTTPLEKEK